MTGSTTSRSARTGPDAQRPTLDGGARRGAQARRRPSTGRSGCSTATPRSGRTDPRVQAAIADRLGWLDAPVHFADEIARARGLRRRRSATRASRRVVAAWAAAASPRTSSTGRSARPTAGSPLRVLDSTDPAAVARDRRRPRPARDALHRRHASRARRPSRSPSRPTLGAHRAGARGAQRGTAQSARRLHGRDHRPGQEPRRDPPPRRPARGVPQPARHRRPLLRADLRRPRAGALIGHRPRPAPRVAPRAMLGRCRDPTRRDNPGLALGLALGRARQPAATS